MKAQDSNKPGHQAHPTTMSKPSLSIEGEFVISRVFDAPRAAVFRAWVDPARVSQWWGPEGMSTPVCELDVRPGGAYRITMRSGYGVDYPITGLFLEVLEPERLVMTMDASEHPPEWHDLVRQNRAKGDDNPAGIMLTTATFDEVAGKTRLTVRTSFETVEIRDALAAMGMNEGWSSSLDRLAALLARRGETR